MPTLETQAQPILSDEQMTHLTAALGNTPTPFQTKLMLRLQQYLNRLPAADECVNMQTDAGLIAMVQAGI